VLVHQRRSCKKNCGGGRGRGKYLEVSEEVEMKKVLTENGADDTVLPDIEQALKTAEQVASTATGSATATATATAAATGTAAPTTAPTGITNVVSGAETIMAGSYLFILSLVL
jgi:hypothetical protein